MKIAIVGGGVVGRCLANVLSDRHSVQLFVSNHRQDRTRLVTDDRKKIIGAPWSFPEYTRRVGSMSVWGGLLAVPKQSTLDAFGLQLKESALIQTLVDTFEVKHCYGVNVGPLRYLLKVNTRLSLAKSVVVQTGIVEQIDVVDQNVVVRQRSGQATAVDFCLIATGAVSVPEVVDDSVRLVPPTKKFDKLICIERRDAPLEAKFEKRGNSQTLAVPIELPITDRTTHKQAVFHHILSRSKVLPMSSIMAGYVVNSLSYLQILYRKFFRLDLPYWFSTYTLERGYPLSAVGKRLLFEEPQGESVSKKLFMPALHSESRVDSRGLEGVSRIGFEHFDIDQLPVPFNPVALRIAKLLAASDNILKRVASE